MIKSRQNPSIFYISLRETIINFYNDLSLYPSNALTLPVLSKNEENLGINYFTSV